MITTKNLTGNLSSKRKKGLINISIVMFCSCDKLITIGNGDRSSRSSHVH